MNNNGTCSESEDLDEVKEDSESLDEIKEDDD